MRLRIDLAYDGGPFHGFARQPGLTTVQGALEGALSRLLGQPARTTAAGRTDRGVHATAQVVHIDVDPTLPRAGRSLVDLDDLRERVDRLSGEAIAIWAITVVPAEFDARSSATERRYRYRIAEAPVIHPLQRFDVWQLGKPLHLEPMRAGASYLTGEHDFASLCRAAPGRGTVRRVDRITITRDGAGFVRLQVRGPAFCHQQVRSTVGLLVEVGLLRKPSEWVGEVLDARDRSRAPRVAPPQGLTLERVSYGRRFPAAPPPHVR